MIAVKEVQRDGIHAILVRFVERTKRIPVVVLTSSAEESDMIRSYRLRLNSYLVKPGDFGKFIDEVSKAWVLLGADEQNSSSALSANLLPTS